MLKYFFLTILLTGIVFQSTMAETARINGVEFQKRPYQLQLYTRNASDSATVFIEGNVVETDMDSASVTVYKNGIRWNYQSTGLNYSVNTAPFSLAPRIHAGMNEYTFVIELVDGTERHHVLTVDSVTCGDAYIINGQSNAHYAWSDATYRNEFCRTFGVKTPMSNYDPYAAGDTLWSLSQGSSSLGPGVGTLGIYIQKFILEEQGMPTCLINGGTGGSVVAEHLPVINRLDLTSIYGKLLYRVRKSGIGTIRAMIWHQGENDATSDNIKTYRSLFSTLYQAWKTDYEPEAIYLYQICPNGSGDAQGKFRELQRTLPDSLGKEDIVLVSTVGLPGHDGLHYSHAGYRSMTAWVYKLIRADFYASEDTVDIHPPNIRNAVYEPARREIHLVFDNAAGLSWPEDSLGQSMKDYFYLDNEYGMIETGRAHNDSVILKLNAPQFIDFITYLPDKTNNTNYDIYEGPWIRNSRGIGALSFRNFPVRNPDRTIKVIAPNGGEIWAPNSEQSIQWTYKNVGYVSIQFSSDNGFSWDLIAENISADAGSYTWTTPDIASTGCKIRISSAEDERIADESNHIFGIYAKSIMVLSPNGGEKWPAGSLQTITWTSRFVEHDVQIKYSADAGSSWTTIKRWIGAAEESLQWQIPDNISGACKVRIIDLDDLSVFDDSDTTFAIIEASGVRGEDGFVPEECVLMPNYPNPFNSGTVIPYILGTRHSRLLYVELDIYDILGQKIKSLVSEFQSPGTYRIFWDAADRSSGVYYYRLSVFDGVSEIEGRFRKMVVLK